MVDDLLGAVTACRVENPVQAPLGEAEPFGNVPHAYADAVVLGDKIGDLPNSRRGAGIADMVKAIESGVPHKASAELAYHTTDVILSMDEAAEAGSEKKVASTVDKPDGLWLSQDSILWA